MACRSPSFLRFAAASGAFVALSLSVAPLAALDAAARRASAGIDAGAPPEPVAAAPASGAPLENGWDSPRGRLRRLHRPPRPAAAGGLEARARAILSEHAPVLGVATGGFDLDLVSQRQSPSGPHLRFRQLRDGIPLWGAEAVVSFDAAGDAVLVCSDLVEAPAGHTATAAVPAAAATATALASLGAGLHPYAPPECGLYWRHRAPGWHLEYRVAFACASPPGDWEVWIDAATAAVRERRDRTVFAGTNGLGRVFDPDPTLSVGDPSLVDGGDADAAVPAGAYSVVPLRDLDPPSRGYYRLRGPNVAVQDWESPAGAPDSSLDGEFLRWRAAQGFEDVMVYFHIDAMQRWYQALGFLDANRRQQVADAHGLQGQDNSKFVPSLHKIAFGEGGVDDAEDAGVIIHEYGHATQFDIVPTWGTGGHTSAMGEGFGDYLANSYAWSRYRERVEGWNGVFFWDGHNEFWPGRRAVDPALHYPENAGDAVHRAGTLWCSALTEMLYALGDRAIADRLVLDHHFALTGSATMEDAANAILVSDLVLYAGAHVGLLVEIFGRWGLVDAAAYKPVQIQHQPLDAAAAASGAPRLTAIIRSTAAAVDPRAVRAYLRTPGGAWMDLPMAPLEGEVFEATLPLPVHANLQLEYWLEAADVAGNRTRLPAAAPGAPFAFEVGLVAESFESESGWQAGVPEDDAGAGRWVRAEPIGTVAQPSADHTIAGKTCFVTGNGPLGAPASQADVDGGQTTLLSPVFDLRDARGAWLVYWRWFSNDQGSSPHEDPWVVEASNDGGSTWVEVERTMVSEPRWRRVEVDLAALFGSLDRLRVRFVASDRGGASLVEAAVDDVVLRLESPTEASSAATGRTSILAASRNPIVPGSRLHFSVARRGPAQLALYDARGTRVRLLAAGPLEAGSHALTWDGLDAGGAPLPSGVYFATLTTAVERVSRKLVLVQ